MVQVLFESYSNNVSVTLVTKPKFTFYINHKQLLKDYRDMFCTKIFVNRQHFGLKPSGLFTKDPSFISAVLFPGFLPHLLPR